MKKTLRLIGLCALVMLAAVSCKKNEEKNVTFQATLTQPSSDSKTHIDANNNLVWNSGDQIKVYTADNTEASAAVFSTTSNNTMTATFSGTLTESASYTAFYPAEGVTVSGSKILMPLNATQTFVDGNMASGAYPMYATGTGETFTFHSPAGLMMLKFMGSGTIGSVELTDKNGANLAGNYEVDPANNTCTFVGNATTVTLNCGEGVALNTETETVMYFVLPAGVFDGGFTAVVKNTTGGEMYTLSTTRANLIVAEKILEMPTVNVAAIGVTTGTAVAGDVPTTMTLNGSYSAPAGMSVSEVGFYFGQGAALTKYPATLNNPFSLVRDGLAEGTEYSYQAYAVNGSNEILGSVETFTTGTSMTVPSVTTSSSLSDVSATGATCGGTITNDGNDPTNLTYGICYSTTDGFEGSTGTHVEGSNLDNGAFTVALTGLTGNTQYYFRAYANNSVGTSYGDQYTFNTLRPGLLNGMFSVSATKQVHFSQGNLQYTKSTGVWSFMEHQYDIVETSNQNVGSNYANQDVVSLFGYGTSGYNNGQSNYQPYSTSTSGFYRNNLTGSADWGYNAISNGGNEVNSGWRTLTKDEWTYVFRTRAASAVNGTANARFAGAIVNGVYGVILFPDIYTHPSEVAQPTNINSTGTGNNYSDSDFAKMQVNGAVFLPAAGQRYGTNVQSNVQSYGYYWTSTMKNSSFGDVYTVEFYSGSLQTDKVLMESTRAYSVRLVRDAE